MSKRKVVVNIVTLCLLVCILIVAVVMARRTRPSAAEAPVQARGEYYVYQTPCDPDLYHVFLQTIFADMMPPDSDLNARMVLDYPAYQAFCRRLEQEQFYTDPDKYYLVITEMGTTRATLCGLDVQADRADVYVSWPHFDVFYDEMITLTVPIDTPVETVAVHDAYTEAEYQNLMKYGSIYDPDVPPPEPAKPIIYLYPEQETDVTVTLGYPELVTHSYPKYDGPWRVTAQPDGTLTDLKTGRALYSLYYENVSAVPLPQTDEGFVVRGTDAAAFLEDKLAILGLTEREAEEFIVYWLPRLEENEWNYVRFAAPDEVAAEMPLEIEPEPDSLIRVLMLYRPLEAPIPVTPQPLETPRRTGFTAVEWGGTELP